MPTTNTKPGLHNSATRAEDLSAGTLKHFPDSTQKVMVGGVAMTVGDVNTKLQEINKLRTATEDAQASARTKVAAEQAQLPPLLLFMAAYVAYVKATFGNQPDVLGDFGLAPRKPRKPLTAEQKAAAKEKAKATRAARGTKGPVAKLDTVGNVIGVTVTPIIAPTAPTPATPAAPPAPQPAPAPVTASAPVAGVSSGGTGGTGTTPHS